MFNSRFIFGVVLFTACWSFVGCKPPNNSQLQAIVSSDGLNATGLLPIRQKFEYGVDLPMGIASMVEDAMRLTYGAVECYGEDSASLFNLLEDVSRYSVLGLKRVGNKIYIPNRSFEEALNATPNLEHISKANKHLVQENSFYKTIDTKNCTLVGEHTLSVGSFVMIMTDPSIDFELKQIIWLAARGRSNQNVGVFSGSFYKFLRENLGATPIENQNGTEQTLRNIDSQFNPCVNGKEDIFICDANKNYQVRGDYKSVLNRFLGLVATFNQSYLKALEAGDGEAKDATKGLRIAALVSKDIPSSDLMKQNVQEGTSAPAPSRDITKRVHPAIAVMLPHLPRIQSYFQVHVGTAPGSVIDPENPMAISYSTGAPRQQQQSGRVGFNLLAEAGAAAASAAPAKSAPVTAGPVKSPPTSAPPKTPTTAAPVQRKIEPLTFESIKPATNIQNTQGDSNYWTRSKTNPNQFYHEENGVRWESNAVKRPDGGWSYRNTQSRGSEVLQEKILFQGSDLVGGAGKGTFVEYGIKNKAEVDLQVPGTFANQQGRLFTQDRGDGGAVKNQWLNFEAINSTSPDASLASGKPIDIRVPTGAESEQRGQVLVNPYRFTDSSSNSQAYLANIVDGDNKSGWQWLTPPKQEAPPVISPAPTTIVKQPSAPAAVNPSKMEPAESGSSATIPAATRVAIAKETQVRNEVVAEQGAKVKVAEVEAKKSFIPGFEYIGTAGQNITAQTRKLFSEFDLLENLSKKAAELQANPNRDATQEKELRALNAKIPEQELAVTWAEQEEYAFKNIPPQRERHSPAVQRVLAERNAQIEEQQKLAALAAKDNVSQSAILEQKLAVEAKRLEVAKREREAFQARNGDRFSSASILERWNPFGRAYDNPAAKAYDRYTPAQSAEKNALHSKVSHAEQVVAELQRQLQTLRGNNTAARAIPTRNSAAR